MGSKQESLNKRIRETITSLSDEQLSDMRRASDKNYTPFARKVVEEELTRRRKIVAAKDAASENNASLAGNREEVARGTDEGCYIEVWSDKNFAGENLRIEGPGEYQTLEFAGLAWGDTISSLRVGSGAFVLVYSEREFQGKMLTFGPNQEVVDFNQLNFNDEIDSISVANSFKIFDGFRSEAAVKAPIATETKRTPKRLRRKSAAGARMNTD